MPEGIKRKLSEVLEAFGASEESESILIRVVENIAQMGKEALGVVSLPSVGKIAPAVLGGDSSSPENIHRYVLKNSSDVKRTISIPSYVFASLNLHSGYIAPSRAARGEERVAEEKTRQFEPAAFESGLIVFAEATKDRDAFALRLELCKVESENACSKVSNCQVVMMKDEVQIDETSTYEEGLVEFFNLKPGRYQFKFDLYPDDKYTIDL